MVEKQQRFQNLVHGLFDRTLITLPHATILNACIKCRNNLDTVMEKTSLKTNYKKEQDKQGTNLFLALYVTLMAMVFWKMS